VVYLSKTAERTEMLGTLDVYLVGDIPYVLCVG